MVVRIAGYGYQRGFGGHFHNDDAVGVLRDIPGLVIASPARPDDAAAMLGRARRRRARTAPCASSSSRSRSTTRAICTRTATTAGSRRPTASTSRSARRGRTSTATTSRSSPGRTGCSCRSGSRAGSQAHGSRARVVDLRWLAPLPVEDILREAEATGRVLVVDETRRTGGVSEGVVAELVDAGFDGPVARVASKDSFVPLGDAATLVLVSEDEIEAAARALVQ